MSEITEVINVMVTSGSVTDVGKTTFSKQLTSFLRGRGRKVEFVGVEASSKPRDGEDIRIGTEKEDVNKIVGTIFDGESDLIVDVGGDNFASLVTTMRDLGDTSLRAFTHYIVLITPDIKHSNIIATIKEMIERGVPQQKIHLVFSKVLKDGDHLIKSFLPVIEVLTELDVHIVKTPILKNDLISKQMGKESIFEIDTETDFEALAFECRAQKKKEEALQYYEMTITSSMAKMAKSNFAEVFQQIFGKI